MKKIIVFIIFLMIPFNVSALNYKTTTEKNKITKNDIVIKQEKLYKHYKNIKEYDKDYTLEKENNKNYPHKSNKYIEKEQEYQQPPEEKLNRIITRQKYNIYKQLKQIKRIIITNAILYIYEIEIYDNNDKIIYTFSEHNKKDYQILNNNKEEGMITQTTHIIDIVLSKKVNVENLKIKLHTKKYFSNPEFRIIFYPDKIEEEYQLNNHMQNKQNEYITKTCIINYKDYNIKEDTYKIEKNDIKNYEYEDEEITTLSEFNSDYYEKIGEITRYNVKDKMFLYYKEKREYKSGYYKELKDYIKDKNKYIIKYTYTKKDKQVNPIKSKGSKIINEETKTKTIKTINYIENQNQNNITKMSKNKKNNYTKTNKNLYLIPVIMLLLISIIGYTLYSLIKE